MNPVLSPRFVFRNFSTIKYSGNLADEHYNMKKLPALRLTPMVDDDLTKKDAGCFEQPASQFSFIFSFIFLPQSRLQDLQPQYHQ